MGIFVVSVKSVSLAGRKGVEGCWLDTPLPCRRFLYAKLTRDRGLEPTCERVSRPAEGGASQHYSPDQSHCGAHPPLGRRRERSSVQPGDVLWSETAHRCLLQGLLGDGRLRVPVGPRQPYGVHFPRVLERVQLVVHHPAVLEAQAVLPIDGGARPRRHEALGRVQEGVELLRLGVALRLFDDGQLSVRKRLVRVHLHSVVSVVQAVGVAGVGQQVTVHHGLIDGVVDVGVVVGSAFEADFTGLEDTPFANVDGCFLVRLLALFPVKSKMLFF